MNLIDSINNDLISAMKSKNKIELNTLRSVKGAVQLEFINNKKAINDELILDVINKQIKMRNDSITEFKKANRQDLIDSYQQEINILNKYMPKLLSDEELNKIIDDVFVQINPTSLKDLGKIMKEIVPKVKNKCDMNKLNQLIKERLN